MYRKPIVLLSDVDRSTHISVDFQTANMAAK